MSDSSTRDSDGETVLEQPEFDEPLLEQPVLEQPARWLDARLARVLIAVTVILGSAAVGYLASRIWPLTDSSGSKLQVASTAKSNAFEPKMHAPVVAVNATTFAEPSASVATRPLEQSQLSAPANPAAEPQNEPTKSEPEKSQPKGEPSDLARSTAGGAVAVLNAGTAQQASDDTKTPDKTEKRLSKRERAAAARREAASKRKPSRIARTQQAPDAAPAFAKSASAGAGFRDPALNEFMTTPKRF